MDILRAEWAHLQRCLDYVLSPVPLDSSHEAEHGGMTLDDFVNCPQALCLDSVRLSKEHIVVLRLFTGDGHQHISRYRRARQRHRKWHKTSAGTYARSDGWLLESLQQMRKSNGEFGGIARFMVSKGLFPITCALLDEATWMLAQNSSALTLFCGIKGNLASDMLASVWEDVERDQEPALQPWLDRDEWGAQSMELVSRGRRSKDPVALDASVKRAMGSEFGRLMLVLEARQGNAVLVDGRQDRRMHAAAADVAWVSQFPGQTNVLFPGNTMLHPRNLSVRPQYAALAEHVFVFEPRYERPVAVLRPEAFAQDDQTYRAKGQHAENCWEHIQI